MAFKSGCSNSLPYVLLGYITNKSQNTQSVKLLTFTQKSLLLEPIFTNWNIRKWALQGSSFESYDDGPCGGTLNKWQKSVKYMQLTFWVQAVWSPELASTQKRWPLPAGENKFSSKLRCSRTNTSFTSCPNINRLWLCIYRHFVCHLWNTHTQTEDRLWCLSQ